MRLHRWNGEHWYEDDTPVWRRLLKWVAWFGGWEAHSPKSYFVARRWPLRWRLTPKHLAPVSLFGHRVTYYGWGIQWKRNGGWWVVVWEREKVRNLRRIYWSPDGTPSNATKWLYGAPQEVVHATQEWQQEVARREAETRRRFDQARTRKAA